MSAVEIERQEEKLGELLLYIAKRCSGDAAFGATKLNKILFFSEFEAYRDLGSAITGVPYQNLELGPAPRRLLPVQTRLIDSGFARLDHIPTPTGMQKRLVPLREPNLGSFSDHELELVDRVIERLRSRNASQASQDSHEEVGWLATSTGETIPYHMALLSRPAPTVDDEKFIERLAASGVLPGHP